MVLLAYSECFLRTVNRHIRRSCGYNQKPKAVRGQEGARYTHSLPWCLQTSHPAYFLGSDHIHAIPWCWFKWSSILPLFTNTSLSRELMLQPHLFGFFLPSSILAFIFVLVFLRSSLMYPRLLSNSLCSWGCPWISFWCSCLLSVGIIYVHYYGHVIMPTFRNVSSLPTKLHPIPSPSSQTSQPLQIAVRTAMWRVCLCLGRPTCAGSAACAWLPTLQQSHTPSSAAAWFVNHPAHALAHCAGKPSGRPAKTSPHEWQV